MIDHAEFQELAERIVEVKRSLGLIFHGRPQAQIEMRGVLKIVGKEWFEKEYIQWENLPAAMGTLAKCAPDTSTDPSTIRLALYLAQPTIITGRHITFLSLRKDGFGADIEYISSWWLSWFEKYEFTLVMASPNRVTVKGKEEFSMNSIRDNVARLRRLNKAAAKIPEAVLGGTDTEYIKKLREAENPKLGTSLGIILDWVSGSCEGETCSIVYIF